MSGRGGYKRNRRGAAKQNVSKAADTVADVDETSPIIQGFRSFQNELDTRHDRHERIVKLSRDITIESKRTIFLLHRTVGTKDKDAVMKEAQEKLEEIRETKWRNIAAELQGQDPYQFLRAFSAGLQEYVEAVSLYQYLQDGTLVSQAEVENQLSFDRLSHTDDNREGLTEEASSHEAKGESMETDQQKTNGQDENDLSAERISVHIPPVEFVLGLADLTGELMRMAINSVGNGDLETPSDICKFLRFMHDAFVAFGNANRELSRKVWTLKESMKKVENVCYTLKVRGSEVPKHMLVDVIKSQKSDFYGAEEANLGDE